MRKWRTAIKRAVIFARCGTLEFDLAVTGSSLDPISFAPRNAEKAEGEYLTEPEMQRRERENLLVVLQKTGWKIKGVNGAAELLGVKPTTLISRMEKMDLTRPAC